MCTVQYRLLLCHFLGLPKGSPKKWCSNNGTANVIKTKMQSMLWQQSKVQQKDQSPYLCIGCHKALLKIPVKISQGQSPLSHSFNWGPAFPTLPAGSLLYQPLPPEHSILPPPPPIFRGAREYFWVLLPVDPWQWCSAFLLPFENPPQKLLDTFLGLNFIE